MSDSPDLSPETSVRSLVRLVLLFRLIALNVTIAELGGNHDQAARAAIGLVLAALLSYLPLRYWDRWAPQITTRPIYLAGDLTLNLALYAALGPASPFFLYTLGTPLMAGVLFRRSGALALGGAMVIGYYLLVIVSGSGLQDLPGSDARDLQALVALPALYPLAALGGAAVRSLLDRQSATLQALAEAEFRAVAGAERSRVAREMHDSLGKSLYGIALAARGLSHRVAREAPDAAAQARELSTAAQVAAEEARGLISDLRSDTLERPLSETLERYVVDWSQRSGVDAEVEAREVDLPHPGTRYELFCIVREALENVERHAQASTVAVKLVELDDEQIVLSVADDGVGFEADGDAAAIEPDGHFGLIGMVERGDRVGAKVSIDGELGEGTTVSVRLPTGDVRTAEPWALAEGER